MLISKSGIWYLKRDSLFSVSCWASCSVWDTTKRRVWTKSRCLHPCMCARVIEKERELLTHSLSSSLKILYFFLLSGTALIRRQKIPQPEESITCYGMAEPSETGAVHWDLVRTISDAQQDSAVSKRWAWTRSSHIVKRRQILQHRLKNIRIAIYLIPNLLNYSGLSFPTKIPVRYIL